MMENEISTLISNQRSYLLINSKSNHEKGLNVDRYPTMIMIEDVHANFLIMKQLNDQNRMSISHS
jgi:hypothetical protein